MIDPITGKAVRKDDSLAWVLQNPSSPEATDYWIARAKAVQDELTREKRAARTRESFLEGARFANDVPLAENTALRSIRLRVENGADIRILLDEPPAGTGKHRKETRIYDADEDEYLEDDLEALGELRDRDALGLGPRLR